MKSKFLTALIIVLAMTAGCTTAEKASMASSGYDVKLKSTANVQETNDTVSDNNENIEPQNSCVRRRKNRICTEFRPHLAA